MEARIWVSIVTGIVILWYVLPQLIVMMFRDINLGNTEIGRLDRKLNQAIYLDILLSFWLLIASVYAIVRLARSGARWRLFWIVLIVFLNILIIYPIMSVMNIALMLYCRNGPFLTREDAEREFPAEKNIEAAHDKIRREFEAFDATAECTYKQVPGFRIGSYDEGGRCWRIVQLKRMGRLLDESTHFPETAALIADPQIHNAMFSILDPGVEIPSHIGYYKGYLRYHLGVIVPTEPESPYIVCGGEKYLWKEGEGIVFDDMYYHHVNNPSNGRRVVLYLDVIRRNLPEPLNVLNQIFTRAVIGNPFVNWVVGRQHRPIATEDPGTPIS